MSIYNAKFIRKVTTATTPRMRWKYDLNIAEDGLQYYFDQWNVSGLKVGDHVLIAKLRNTHHSQAYVWDIYEIELPIHKWMHLELGIERPKTWYGNCTYIVRQGKKPRHLRK